MTGARSRLAAAELLMCALEERRKLDEAMEQTRSYALLHGPDRGFARAMASAALRQLGQINTGLAPFLSRPLETATPPSRALLQIGAAQLWLMETPVHAAVGETVAAAKLWPRARRAAGFLNAVLRKAAADRSGFDAADPLSVWPDWLSQHISQTLGPDAARSLATHQTSAPTLQLSVKSNPSEALKRFQPERSDAQMLENGSLELPTGQIETLPGYAEGNWWVQDAGASLPAKLVGARPGMHIVDLCAAPGGKTMQLAATGAKVTAIDRSEKRNKRLADNLDRTKLAKNVDIQTIKGEDWQLEPKADACLLDAPCSALGTLRRHPEGAWIKTPDNIAQLPAIQTRLLEAALTLTKPGGLVVYCVCTPLPEEGINLIGAAIKKGACSRVAIRPDEVPGFTHAITEDGDLLTLPGGPIKSDIFYIARLRTPAPLTSM